ncbi:MAG: TraR/DksA family transcriptional regulator [Planctomycetota bacterium]|jgi:DnaK suppressor protein
MPRRYAQSRAKKRQEMLRELSDDEAVDVLTGNVRSRTVEAVEALRRIEDGTYGFCVDCHLRIPQARMLAKPEATRCADCQTQFKRRGGARRVARRSA